MSLLSQVGSVHFSVFFYLLWYLQTDSASSAHALVCNSSTCMESSRQSIWFCLSLMYCIVLSIRLFSRGRWMDVWYACYLQEHKLVDTMCHVPPPSVETGCFLQILINPKINLSVQQTYFFPWRLTMRESDCLSFGSMATTHSHRL